MEWKYLLKGLIFGFSIAAPVGPIGVLCIRRTLASGWLAGLVTGLGVATADAFYGVVAGLGLTFLSNLLLSQQTWFNVIGGLFLCYLGVTTFITRPAQKSASLNAKGAVMAYFSVLLFALTSPMTIITFAAMFAGLGLASTQGNYLSAGLLVAGIFLGSASWWLILSSTVDHFRSRFNQQRMIWVNRFSGVIILAFGIFVVLRK